ncbi:GntR family transcriptional regulator [Acrocarpospora sp. B8E8]|uniref:GntR family transcriptional regulator n=1 Tax=Acrocarpospora sp. B8E8 TaxID=3153572 RepID=UPI00325E9DBC
MSVEQVAGPYQAGQGIRAIAASLGVSVGKVRTQLEAAGIQIRRGPRPKPVTAADEDLIRRYQNGESIRVIATSRRTDGKKVRAQLVAAGVRIRRRRDARRLAEVTDEELAGRYQAGQSLSVIAASLDVDPGTVRARLAAAGVEIRPPGRIRKHADISAKPQLVREQREVRGEELADLYRAGSTVAALVERFGVSKEKVRARLRAEGVAMRRPGRRPTADVAARTESSATPDRPVGRRSWPGGEQPGTAQPVSRAMADEAVAPIRSGALVAGARLPSHRARTQAVTPGNARARRAVNLPRQEGQLVTINKTTVVAPPENRPGRREQDKPMSERTGRPGRANLIRQDGMTPIYMQIADLIAKEIANGDLAPGAWIDSERELQSEFGIAQITARSVHRELCDRGLVRTVPGEGTFVNRAWTPLQGERDSGSDRAPANGSSSPGTRHRIRRDGMAPMYAQIADIIEEKITKGELGPGDMVPSETEVKRDFGVAQMTARRVHRELRERGLAHTVPGEGTFVGPEGTPRPAHMQPLYQQIANELAAAICAGRHRPGDPITSERDLMVEFGVAKATIRQTIASLRTDGWVITVPYRGTFVAPPHLWPEPPQDVGGPPTCPSLEPGR